MRAFALATLTITLLFLSACTCSVDQEQQAILDFINDPHNMAVAEQAVACEDQWEELNYNSQKYTRTQLVLEWRDLERQAGQVYRDMSEIVPPRSLRSFWQKEVEACSLLFQAVSLTNQAIDDPTINLSQINESIFKANDLKTEALWELEDICKEHGIDLGQRPVP